MNHSRRQSLRLAVRVLILVASATAAIAWARPLSGPRWTVGRAVIDSPGGAMVLKLSLRNVGSPGRLPVRIYGRWMDAASRARPRLLGSYQREVALTQTAILQMSLAALGLPRERGARLELVVTTNSTVTDRSYVRLRN